MENLVKIQNDLKVPKGNFNSFGKYKYRSCEDILEAVKPLLLKYNCNLTLTDELIQLGSKIFVKSTAKLKDSTSEECSNGFAETSEHKGMSAEQTTGTASSYARKYALNGLFLIDETESDPDSQNKNIPLTEQVENAKSKIINASSLEDLKTKWSSLTKTEQLFQEVTELKDKLKQTLK